MVREGHLQQNIILLLGVSFVGNSLALGGLGGSRGSWQTLVLLQRLGLDDALLHGLEHHHVLLHQLLDELLGGSHLGVGLEDDTIVQRGQKGPSNFRVLLEKLGEEALLVCSSFFQPR